MVLEVLSLSSTPPVKATVILCVWTTHTSLTAPEVVTSAATSPEPLASAVATPDSSEFPIMARRVIPESSEFSILTRRNVPVSSTLPCWSSALLWTPDPQRSSVQPWRSSSQLAQPRSPPPPVTPGDLRLNHGGLLFCCGRHLSQLLAAVVS